MSQSRVGLDTFGPRSDAVRAALRMTSTVANFLVIDGGDVSLDWSGYVHPSALPVAVIYGALIDRPTARKIYGEARLPMLVAGVPRLDTPERAAVAALAGVHYQSPVGPALFTAALLRQAIRFGSVFTVSAEHVEAHGHYGIRPDVDKAREAAKGLNDLDKTILATILGLYTGDGAANVFRYARLPRAVEALSILNEVGGEQRDDFYTLLSCYPGW